jgi:hypothetical protein
LIRSYRNVTGNRGQRESFVGRTSWFPKHLSRSVSKPSLDKTEKAAHRCTAFHCFG